jgi:hypothetical protein
LQLSEGEQAQLLTVSAATIDRILGDARVAAAGGRRGQFPLQTGIAGALLFQPLDAAVNHRNVGSHVAQAIMSWSELFVGVFELISHFRSEILDARIEQRNVLLRRDVNNDVREHVADFRECCLLCCHMQQVYHTGL